MDIPWDNEELGDMMKMFQSALDTEYGKGEKDARKILQGFQPVVEILLDDKGELIRTNRKIKMCYARDGLIMAALLGALNSVLFMGMRNDPQGAMSLAAAIRELSRVFWMLGYASASSYGIEDWEVHEHLDDKEDDVHVLSDQELRDLWSGDNGDNV